VASPLVRIENSTSRVGKQTDALIQQLEEREYDSEGNWLFPKLSREASVEILEQFCSEVGLTEYEYPAHTHDVLMLAKELEHKISAYSPSYYANQGFLCDLVSLPRYGFQWQPETITQLLMVAEYRKAWQPKSPRHESKKSRWCLVREKSDAARNRREFEALKQMPIADLLQNLAETPKLESRLVLHKAVTFQLESLGIV
jgi:hypothetical protein